MFRFIPICRISRGGLLFPVMASLAWFEKKYGKLRGRKQFNAYHRAYYLTHRKQMRDYMKRYRATKKAALSVAQ